MTKFSFEPFAVSKYPKTGKCKNSCFADGSHRVGLIPVLSILDGAISGDSCQEICLECQKVFNKRMFIVRNQPNQLLPRR